MKKYISTILCMSIVIFMICTPCLMGKTLAQNQDVRFYTQADDSKKEFFLERFDYIVETIKQAEGITGEIYASNLIKIYGMNAYYVLICSNDTCIAIASVGEYNGRVVLNWGHSFADEINALTAGEYYFFYDGENTYIEGNGITILVESNHRDLKNSGLEINYSRASISGDLIDAYDQIITSEGREPLRSVVTQYLNMGTTSFPNNGYPGYCWLCAACDISKYLGGSNVNIATAHTYVHGTDHAVWACPQGTLTDARNVVSYYTQKTGDTEYNPLDFSSVVISIQYSDPIYSRWDANNNDKHAMVVCGYTYDNSSGIVTYWLRDSNHSGQYCYATGYDNSTTVNYYVNGTYYTWAVSIYNWQ